MKLWVLWGLDPRTGAATRPAGAVGVDGGRAHVSMVPLEATADFWRPVLATDDPQVLQRRLTRLEASANGITAAVTSITPCDESDLVAAVEALVDRLLCMGEPDG